MNLVIVEDSLLIRAQLQRLLAFLPGIRVVGMASGESEAFDIIQQSNPDVVLLDLFLSPGSGLNVLSRLRQAGNTVRVVVLSNHTSDALRRTCADNGVAGYFDKSYDMARCIDQLQAWLPQTNGESPSSQCWHG